jgi:membrane protein
VSQVKRFLGYLHQALWHALEHDVLGTAKGAAYSGVLMLFPALVVITTLLAMAPEGPSLTSEIRTAFEQALPDDSMSLLQSAMEAKRLRSTQLLLSATGFSIFAGLGVMLSLMEGFRRAYRNPVGDWGFWTRRMRALLLVPIVLLPLALATLLVVFGRQIEMWMTANANHQLKHVVLFLWRMVRWAISMLASMSVLGLLYHFGTKRKEHWIRVGPGAVAATVVWFPATLAFGWYVTRIADYSMFYGSFGAGIATLVWLYITAFSVLLGAELNGAMYLNRQGKTVTSPVLLAGRAEEKIAEADASRL